MATITVDMTGVVKKRNTPVKSRASSSSSTLMTLTQGISMDITKQDGDWYYSSTMSGWINKSNLKVSSNLTITNVSKEDSQSIANQTLANNRASLEAQIASVDSDVDSDVDEDDIVDSLIVSNLNGIYGIPYQFMESVDPRIGDSVMGRKYSERILSKMPLLCFTPGKVEFMSNYKKSEKEGVLAALISKINDVDVNNIVDNNGRYFTFAFNYAEYFEYVNGLCATGARFLNIQNVVLNIGDERSKAKDFDWGNALNSDLKATLTSQEFIAFYMDSTDSVSESFSNDTTQSQLLSSINSVSDTAREIGFLLGAGAGIDIGVMDEAAMSETMANIENISQKYLNGSTILSNLANGFATVATGGKLLFPEIWSDSSFSRNYDINIKLRTPDCDTMSWYLNIYVPLCHLIALAAGHQTEHVNGYYSPFLIRAYYKGLFNVDMGIITDLSITKGKEAAWNIDGLPTEVDVSITIKDLYGMLSIVPANEPKNFVTNNILMDYIANTCGININQMDIARSLEIYYILTKNAVTDLPNTITRRFQDALDRYSYNLYNKALAKYLI